MEMPKKFYVARVFRGTDQILGFMVDADKEHTKAFEKKKASADRWATNGNLEPIYVDNEPKTGFVMVTNVSRYSTSNVVWRCRHPEGFEFEITSSNMCDLIANNTIVKGEFQDAMFFNASRELINSNTQTYAKMVEAEEKKEERKNFADSMEPGNGFKYEHSDDEYVYLGEYHAICENKNKDYNFPAKSTKYHAVKNLTTGKYILRAKMSDRELVLYSKSNQKIDRTKVIQELISHAYDTTFKVPGNHYECLDEGRLAIHVSETPFKFKDLIVQYETIPLANIGKFMTNMIYLAEDNGIQHRVFFGLIANKSKSYSYYSDDFEMYSKYSTEYDYLCAYPCELGPNGLPTMDVDMTTHKTFARWHYSSPFYPPNKKHHPNSGYTGVPTKRIPVSENITIGRYTLGK